MVILQRTAVAHVNIRSTPNSACDNGARESMARIIRQRSTAFEMAKIACPDTVNEHGPLHPPTHTFKVPRVLRWRTHAARVTWSQMPSDRLNDSTTHAHSHNLTPGVPGYTDTVIPETVGWSRQPKPTHTVTRSTTHLVWNCDGGHNGKMWVVASSTEPGVRLRYRKEEWLAINHVCA